LIDQGRINAIAIESSLHKWQKMWSANPETVHLGKNSEGLFCIQRHPFLLARYIG
jgi:hypothetical protein